MNDCSPGLSAVCRSSRPLGGDVGVEQTTRHHASHFRSTSFVTLKHCSRKRYGQGNAKMKLQASDAKAPIVA
jgi:hypothetical protein